MRELQATRGAPITDETPVPADENAQDVTPPAGDPTSTKPAGRRRNTLVLFAGVAVAGVLLDQLTKIVVVGHLDPENPIRLLGGLLTLRLIRNPGAAFSMGEQFTWVFATLAVAVLVFIVVRLVPRLAHTGWAVALGLLCAGITGNLLDRLFRAPGPFRGHVVDFFQLPHFAIFNVADMCITSAAVMIVVLAMIKGVGIDGTRYSRG